jgi:hypothetical protein
VALVPAPPEIESAVAELCESSGLTFRVSETEVVGTQLFVVYAPEHPFPERYTVSAGVLGFRVPRNFPDAGPEDSFFIQPHDVKLKVAEPVRGNADIHRAGVNNDFLKGMELGNAPALVFSWHLWDRSAWNRRKHRLVDHYTHCLRRFDHPEHD